MMICKHIGCPHPNQLEAKFGIGLPEFIDWYGFLLWEHADEEYDDSEKIAYLDQYKREYAD